jgi:hypothetical protein
MRKDRPSPAPSHDALLRRGQAPALQDPAALLRRFIMTEVLGPPVSKRGKEHSRGKPGTGRKER